MGKTKDDSQPVVWDDDLIKEVAMAEIASKNKFDSSIEESWGEDLAGSMLREITVGTDEDEGQIILNSIEYGDFSDCR